MTDCNYPHWQPKECCAENGSEPSFPLNAYPDATFKDRLLGMLGNKLLISVSARICGKETFHGSLCYVGCDYIIVNVCIHRRPVSLYIPMHMIRFFAPDQ